jgi:hypothetical protein
MFACRWPCLPLPGRGSQDASETAEARGIRARPRASYRPAIGMRGMWRRIAGKDRAGSPPDSLPRLPAAEA